MGNAFRHEREWPILLKVAKQYKLSPQQTTLLLAIRQAEAGPPGYELGVKAAKGTDLETQAKWAAGTIKANEKRYNQLMKEGSFKGSRRTVSIKPQMGAVTVMPSLDFVDFMGYYASPTGYGWAPIHDSNMPAKEVQLNKNWSSNVRNIQMKLEKHFKEKGVSENE